MTETNAERLAIIKNECLVDVLKQQLNLREVGFQRVIEDVDWLIEQAELAQVFSKKNIELNEFLQGYSKPKNLGRNVVDVAMDMIREQSERIEDLEKENKRLCEAFEDLRNRAINVVPEREEDGSIIDDPENRFLYEFCSQVLAGDTK